MKLLICFEFISRTLVLGERNSVAPFPIGKNKKVAIKVIDPRGNEVMKVHKLS